MKRYEVLTSMLKNFSEGDEIRQDSEVPNYFFKYDKDGSHIGIGIKESTIQNNPTWFKEIKEDDNHIIEIPVDLDTCSTSQKSSKEHYLRFSGDRNRIIKHLGGWTDSQIKEFLDYCMIYDLDIINVREDFKTILNDFKNSRES